MWRAAGCLNYRLTDGDNVFSLISRTPLLLKDILRYRCGKLISFFEYEMYLFMLEVESNPLNGAAERIR
jgi:hypothetical protein